MERKAIMKKCRQNFDYDNEKNVQAFLRGIYKLAGRDELTEKIIRLEVLKFKIRRSQKNDTTGLSQLQQTPGQGESQCPGG
jgi:hypothetical protein